MMISKIVRTAIVVVLTSTSVGQSTYAILVTGTPTIMPVPPNSGYFDGSPDVSADSLELYFGSNRPGIFGPWSTWVARRDSPSDAFGVPEAVTSLNHPSISNDGLSLYGTGGGDGGSLDLFVVTRPSTDAPWSEPVNLGSGINTAQSEDACHISADGLELYFQRGSYEPTNSFEIWVAKRSDTTEPFGDPVKLPPIINEPTGTWSPEISDDGLTLLFAASRPDGFGLDDLWASTRPTKDDDWGEPVNLGPEVNTAFIEGTADISPDGRTLYFARTVSTDLWGNWDLWQVAIVPGPLGDMNGDGQVNGLDVDPFVDVLLNGPFQVEADMNRDGVVNGLDVDPFVAAVVGGTEQIPEPSTLLLALVALGVAGGWGTLIR